MARGPFGIQGPALSCREYRKGDNLPRVSHSRMFVSAILTIPGTATPNGRSRRKNRPPFHGGKKRENWPPALMGFGPLWLASVCRVKFGHRRGIAMRPCIAKLKTTPRINLGRRNKGWVELRRRACAIFPAADKIVLFSITCSTFIQ